MNISIFDRISTDIPLLFPWSFGGYPNIAIPFEVYRSLCFRNCMAELLEQPHKLARFVNAPIVYIFDLPEITELIEIKQ